MTIFTPAQDIVAAVEALHAHTAIYTAPAAVEALLDRIGWPQAGGLLLDPGAGDGSFLVSAMRRVAPAPADFETAGRVRGMEIHPVAVMEARERVAGVLTSLGWSDQDATLAAVKSVTHGDFLIDGYQGPTPKFIAGNPPYMRFARLPDAFKTLYAAALPKESRGDLQHAFLSRCSEIVETNGAIAFVTADRWLLNDGSAPLRSALGRTLGVDHISRLDRDSCFYRPKSRRRGTAPRVQPVEIVLRNANQSKFALSAFPFSPDGPTETWTGMVLGDIAKVRLAPYVGRLGGFLLNREQAATFDPSLILPALDTDDVDFEGGTIRETSRYVLLTDPAAAPTGQVRDHLQAVMHLMPKKVRLGKWWCPPEAIDRDVSRPALLIPRIAKGIRPVILEGGAVPVNHNITIVTDQNGTGLERLRDALMADEVQDWVARHAPRLEDGYHDIRTTLVRRIPMKDWTTAA